MGLIDSQIETANESLVQMAHDMRAPLLALKAVLLAGGNLDERKQSLIKSSILRLEDLAQNILEKNRSFSWPQSQCLIEASQKLIEEFRSHSKCKIDFHLYSQDHQILLSRETISSLERIMSILISNAIEASSENKIVRVSLFVFEKKVVFEVKDDGLGIDKKDLKFIGQKGFSKKKNGNGLGLAFVKEKLEDLKGKIDVISESKMGTTFKVQFQI